MTLRRAFRNFVATVFGLLAFCSSARVTEGQTLVPTPAWPCAASTLIPPGSFAAGDLDGDGKVDLIYLYTYSSGGVCDGYTYNVPLFNKGGGSFGGPTTDTGTEFSVGSSVAETVATLAQGGTPSVVSVQGSLNLIDVLSLPYTAAQVENNAAILYSNVKVTTPAAAVIADISVVDVNGDGAKDIVAIDSGNNLVYVLLNNGAGAFYTSSTASYALAGTDGPGPILTGDFNHDGSTDFLINNQGAHVITPYYGNGKGTFTVQSPITLYGGIYSMQVADVNADGLPDLLVENNIGAVLVFLGTTSGFSSTATPLIGSNLAGGQIVGVADLNGDGIADIITSTPLGINVFLGQGSLSYKLLGTYDASFGGNPVPTTYAMADFNNDGHVDLAFNAPTGITLLFGNPDGSFQAKLVPAATVVASPEPSTYGTTFTVTLTIPTNSGSPAATGTANFSVGGAAVGTGTVSNGTAMVTVPSPSYVVGSYALSAVYSGDGNYAGATYTGTHTVTGKPSAAAITGLQSPLPYGLTIGETATTTSGVAAVGGTLTVYIDGVIVCTLAANTTSTCPPSTGTGYNAGTHLVYAVFSGDSEYAASTSPTYTVVVIPDNTSANLNTSLTPSAFGQGVTFTAQVIAPYATPTGPVAFLDGGTVIGNGTLNGSGIATYTTSALAIGTHTITAQYAATTNFNATTSPTVQQVVDATAGTGFTLTVTPTALSIGSGSTVSIVAAVTEQAGFAQAVKLSCVGAPAELSCVFLTPTLPAGGGATQLILTPASPHGCSTSTPYDVVTSNRMPRVPMLALAGLGLFLLRRRKRVLRAMLMLGALCALPLVNGCGNCTDFGVKPGTYTFTVTGTSVGTPLVTQSQTVQMVVHL